MPTPQPAAPPSAKKPRPLALVLGLSAAFFAIFLIISGAYYLRGGGASRSGKAKGSAIFSAGSIGVVELNGVIMDSKKTLARLEKMDDDDDIKAVVLRINSPGGSVAPSQEIYEAVKAFRKPLVASMSSLAASGGFYVACGAKKVYANPGTLTGSIGVIMEFVNLEKLYEWARVKRYALKTGKYKGSGAEYREMTADEKALLQAMLDDVLSQFKQAVADGRHLPMAEVDRIADGRIFSGSQAKALKLVDELGTFQDAVNDAAKLAKIEGKPNLVYPERGGRKWLEMLMNNGDSGEDGESDAPPVGARGLGHVIESLARSVLGGGSAPAATADRGPGLYWLWTGPT